MLSIFINHAAKFRAFIASLSHIVLNIVSLYETPEPSEGILTSDIRKVQGRGNRRDSNTQSEQEKKKAH
jgi:hypothetical protein